MKTGNDTIRWAHWHDGVEPGDHGSVPYLARHPHHALQGRRWNTAHAAIAYLGGPMRGLPYFNFPAFDAATTKLRRAGWTIFSPAEKDLAVLDVDRCPTGSEDELRAQGFSLAGALTWDFAKIAESSCVILLPDWQQSTGVHWELTVAYALGKPVFQYPDLTPVDLPEVVKSPVTCERQLHRVDITSHIDFRIPTPDNRPDLFGPTPQDEAITHAISDGVRGANAVRSLPPPERLETPDDEREGVTVVADADGVRRFSTAGSVPLGTDPDNEHPAIKAWRTGVPRGEVRVVDPTTGGEKGSKLARFSLLPWDVLYELAEHYGRGSRKYADRNWEKGYDWSLSIDALGRHLAQWLAGEDSDPETGSSHLIAVAWHALALRWFMRHGKGTDTRSVA